MPGVMRAFLVVSLLFLLARSSAAAPTGAHGRWDFPVSWSPDGRQIVFDSTRAVGACREFSIQPDGRGLRRMPGCGTGYSWAPDGMRLAYARGELRSAGITPGGIFVMDGLGGRVRQLTRALGFVDSLPRWSRDGAWIAFSRTRYHRLGPRSWAQVENVWLVRPDGSGLHRLAHRRGSDRGASWSPDGRQMVFVRESKRLRNDLFVADVRTGHVRRLTYGADNGYPAWSPHGDVIVFERADDLAHDSNVELWSIRPDGSRLRDLAPTANGSLAAWAPNGRLIAYVVDSRRSDPQLGTQLIEIWLMRADGSGQRPLFRHYQANSIPEDQIPVWSPDSKRISFARFDLDGKGISLHVTDTSGQHALRLTY
jgi:Tol biopolymer transport system component